MHFNIIILFNQIVQIIYVCIKCKLNKLRVNKYVFTKAVNNHCSSLPFKKYLNMQSTGMSSAKT